MSIDKNPFPTLLDPTQIMQLAFNQSIDRIRVDSNASISFAGAIQVDITAASGDNIALANSDGSKLVDIETVGGKNGLDVNVLNQIESSPVGLSTNIRTTWVTVTDTRAALPPTPLANRNAISVRVIGTPTVFFGDSTVTGNNGLSPSTDGYPKFQYEEMFADIRDNASVELYGICSASQSCVVAIIELA